ncbi:Protein ELF4-LIKE 4 [Senna tora]|uniref:Protein ELF4-LIKE 4 n=1 Tax=Senna tora TaxID=362788 RepID=A0A834X4M5_9FABA|nr:Protein ELF4-LIKE 4 [Senna tora]
MLVLLLEYSKQKNDEKRSINWPDSLVSCFAIRFKSTTRIPFGGDIHGFGEGGRETSIKINHSSDVVVEFPNKTHVSTEVVGDLGLMILVYLVDEEPVLIQDVLNLNEALLKCLQDLAIYLCGVGVWEKKTEIERRRRGIPEEQ